MLNRIVVANRPQYSAVAHLVGRDVKLQLFTIVCVCALAAAIGFVWVAVAVLCAILVSELAVARLFRRRAPFAGLTKDQTLLIALGICVFNTLLYSTPALFIAQHPSIALKVSALLWSLGIQIYITNTWSRVTPFLFGMLVPAIVMLGLTVFSVASTPPVAGTLPEWAAAFGFILMFIYASVDTLQEHLRTQDALIAAENDASSRLSQLEEAQRLDGLTGLLNRPAFDRALTVMLADRNLTGEEIAVLLVDLDSFKPINDTYSHEAGDRVLIQTGERMRALIGDRGVVGRMGGDEFVCAVGGFANEGEALVFSRLLEARITAPVAWQERQLKVGASVGLAMTGPSPEAPAPTVSGLCSAADQAMFAAKSAASDGPVLYETSLFAPRMTSHDKQALTDALTNKAVRPHYQPKVYLASGQIAGFEALARWHHPDGSVRSPAAFMDQIVELGLQGDFVFSMAHQVVADIRTCLDRGLDPGQVSLNIPEVALATISGRQELQAILDESPRVRAHLTFEITEDVFIARSSDVIQTSISGFRNQGVRISLDDFGTGFASFHHLQRLDFDELKIDTDFVQGLGRNSTAEVLVRGFLDIATGIGVNVVAEGIETTDQARALTNMGCPMGQGHLYSEAVPLVDAIALLAEQRPG